MGRFSVAGGLAAARRLHHRPRDAARRRPRHLHRPKTSGSVATPPSTLAEARLTRRPPSFQGHSAGARRVVAQVQRATRTQVPVLVVGPTGSGRETVARMIHHFGGGEASALDVLRVRRDRRLVGLGAFTYLADLEDLSLEEQLRLPGLVGTGRLVVATRLDPDGPEASRQLHPTVLKWLTGVRIDVPALRERPEDIELLAMGLLRETPARHPIGGISDDALDCMRAYRWPGELDELREVMAHAADVASSGQVELRDLPAKLRMREAAASTLAHERPRDEGRLEIASAEREAILRAITYSRGNRRKAARLLGISKTTLYRKLREYGI
jgi:DNA-binding NtrC family response regulator